MFKQGYQGVVPTIDDDVKFIYGHSEVFAENDSVKPGDDSAYERG